MRSRGPSGSALQRGCPVDNLSGILPTFSLELPQEASDDLRRQVLRRVTLLMERMCEPRTPSSEKAVGRLCLNKVQFAIGRRRAWVYPLFTRSNKPAMRSLCSANHKMQFRNKPLGCQGLQSLCTLPNSSQSKSSSTRFACS